MNNGNEQTESTQPSRRGNVSSRRDFIRTAGGVVAAATAAQSFAIGTAHAAKKNKVLRLGLSGCGNRGTGAIHQALLADPDTKLVAMGDAFSDRLEEALNKLKNSDVGARVDVPKKRQFVGLESHKGVIDSVDVLIMAEPPGFRPRNLRDAIEAGKHCFVEKPVGVDPIGIKSVMESCELAKKKKLNVVSGLCYRYQFAKQEVMKRIHDGAVGKIVAMQTTYNTGGIWHRGRKPEWSEMEYQVRNWYYFDWLSGDFIAEQHVHSLDKMAWAMNNEYPVKVWANGGRAVRTDPKYGNIYDHFNTCFEYANGVRAYSSCRQWENADTDVSDQVFGTEGIAQIQTHEITRHDGKNWKYDQTGPDDMYQNEHNAFFAALRKGEVINNGEYMCKSSMMAIAARMCAYTGKTLTWDQAMNCPLDMFPKKLEWGPIEARPLPRPGETKLPEA